MSKRTDVHSPANLVTEDYEYLFAFDSMEPGRLVGVDMDWWRSITTPRANIHPQGQCDHCGARLRYIALLRHLPTGEVIEVGETCLDNRFDKATAEFHRLRKAAELDRAAQRIVTACREELARRHADGSLSDDAVEFLSDKKGEIIESEGVVYATLPHFIADIRRKFWQYGSLFDGQAAAITRVMGEARAKLSAPAPVAEVEIPAILGKALTIEGLVVSTKWTEGEFSREVMTVKVTTPEGVYRVWGSVPAGLDVDKGCTVRFVANVVVAEWADSTSFAKFTHPRKAEIVGAAEAAKVVA